MADYKGPLDRVLAKCVETEAGCWEFNGASRRAA